MTNPFNPQWLGFSPASDKQIAGGSAPFVYNYLPHDSQSCITAKSMFNTAHAEMYSPNHIIKSNAILGANMYISIFQFVSIQFCTPYFLSLKKNCPE